MSFNKKHLIFGGILILSLAVASFTFAQTTVNKDFNYTNTNYIYNLQGLSIGTSTTNNNAITFSDGTTFDQTNASASWTTDSTGIHYNSGNVGIGVTDPNSALDVNGAIYGTILYDKDNTSYYINPSASSQINGSLNFNSGSNVDDDNAIQDTGYVNFENKENNDIWANDGTLYWDASEGLQLYDNGAYRTVLTNDEGETDHLNVRFNTVDASTYYDKDNTSYYVNPSGTSQFADMLTIGSLELGDCGSNNCIEDPDHELHLQHNTGNGVDVHGGLQIETGNLDMDTHNINNGGSIYGDIFYDEGNTSYYVNPSGTSNLANLQADSYDTSAISNIEPIYIRGTGLNNGGNRILRIGGTTIYNSSGRGLRLTILNKSDNSVQFDQIYDTYGNSTESNNLASKLNSMDAGDIGVLTSFDAWENSVTSNLDSAFLRLGLTKAMATENSGSRRPYAAIFEAAGNSENSAKAVEVSYEDTANQPYAEIRGWLMEGSFSATGDNENSLARPQGDDNALIVDYKGDVGIGTTNPSTRLDVAGGRISDVGSPSSGSDAATKSYVDSASVSDADTVDGLDASDFLRSNANDTFTASNLNLDNELRINNGDGSTTYFNYSNGGSSNYIRGNRLDIDTSNFYVNTALDMNNNDINDIDQIRGNNYLDIWGGSGDRILLRMNGSAGQIGFYDDYRNNWVIRSYNNGDLHFNPYGNDIRFNSNNIREVNNVYASTFYDRNNTSYYLNPASGSNLNSLTINKLTMPGGYTLSRTYEDYNNHLWWKVSESNDHPDYIWQTTDNSTGVTIDQLELNGNAKTAIFAGEIRATIFRDRNNTSYYVNPSSNGTSMHVNNGDITGVDKLDANTVDPVYQIDNKKYATYMAGMVGIKEETTGVVSLDKFKKQDSLNSYTINFTDLEKGSDLWLFAEAINMGNRAHITKEGKVYKTSAEELFNNFSVLLTSGFNGDVWYEKDSENKTITIYTDLNNSDINGEVSYRFTAPRFDWKKWSNKADTESEGLNLDERLK